VDNTRDYARVSHSRQWSNYNIDVKSCRMKLSTLFDFEIDIDHIVCTLAL